MIDFAARRRMMVDTQVRPADVTSFPIIDAMLAVPREVYVPDALRDIAYVGENVSIGPRRVILEPRTFAKMLEAIDAGPEDLVLDVGCGTGYSAAVLARLSQAVVAVEEDEALAAEAEATLGDQGVDNAAVVTGPLVAGSPRHGPFDAVVIEGAVQNIPPTLTDQIKEGGRIVALFMDGALGTGRLGRKIDGRISWRDMFNAGAPVLPGFERHAVFAL